VKVSLNINADLPMEHFREATQLGESAGYGRIWIGENIGFGHPLPHLAVAAEATRYITIGAGIISPQLNRCYHIYRAFQTLREAYGQRFAVALAPGDARELEQTGAETRRPVEAVLDCVRELKRRRGEGKWDFPVYIGASGPRMVTEGSLQADGILLNYIHPDYIEWAMRHMNRKCFVAAYGPALVLPDPVNQHTLRLNVAIILSGANQAFLREFDLENEAAKAREALEVKGMIPGDLDLPWGKFALMGGVAQLREKLEGLADMGIDEVILSTPMCKNLASVSELAMGWGHFP
jgi:alkanesulfonate monooxygenase SsuD/methylene tetrahydromethanopterin reductase-like flavin-dependent oxidoreductase (luciferase family)